MELLNAGLLIGYTSIGIYFLYLATKSKTPATSTSTSEPNDMHDTPGPSQHKSDYSGESITCPECSVQNDPKYRFCENCVHPLSN